MITKAQLDAIQVHVQALNLVLHGVDNCAPPIVGTRAELIAEARRTLDAPLCLFNRKHYEALLKGLLDIVECDEHVGAQKFSARPPDSHYKRLAEIAKTFGD